MKLEISPAALRFMRLMVRADGKPGSGFRLAVSPGGCAGLNADVRVQDNLEPGDVLIERDSVRLFLSAESCVLLEGVTVDFTDTVSQTGLVFRREGGFSCDAPPRGA